ncbi:hypothetical protein FBG13_10715 [Cobetia marina]|jgi:NMD protein affecting ribosome stability and mRNA decay|uniref:TFIIB-type domain-containing protein n=1 Tax=Cobetia marina TaxID=28258 RepID=A0ABU9GE31_COBMA|nr:MULTISPECIES: hypothetical protein [Cobetia]AOM02308.1 hypothetical protein BFX80_14810 [Cobetia marina]AZV32142.1 hypothetical protein CU110_13325 [Cobetia sp. ICG0124]MDA5563086.1 hypothetical protein [Cobetia sp. MMG027]MDH2292524.1 hypothetical protein [Cobetia sp. 10Alg 146]MDH2373233.1 hypothetical protein [Cobetia sp. 3AK]
MSDLSEELRIPKPCPDCGSKRMRVSQVHNPEDKVFCASCGTYVCLYADVARMREEGASSEAEELLEQAANKGIKK